jgi:acyl dehydratase
MAEQPLSYDEVAEGDGPEPFSHTLTRTDLVRYSGASGDFNPMHTDEPAAQAAGLPSVFGHGMFTAGMLAKLVSDYVGVGNLRSYRIRFTQQTWPGEVLTATVRVVGKRIEGDHRLIDLECQVTNDDGQLKLAGSAVAEAA